MSQPDHVQLHRERYHPVEDVTVTLAHTLAGRKTRVIAKRCKMHSRLWERLTDTQQTAAEYVSRCHLAIHRSPNRATDYSRRIEPSASPMPDHIDHRIRQDYKDWLKECRSLGADPIPAVLICGEGYTLRGLSQSARVRVRLAMHLVLGLDAMASVKGWK